MIKLLRRFSYLISLCNFDLLKLVSWHIVSSSVYIVLSGPRIAMSGRSETNTFDNGLYSTPSKSTKTVRFGLLFEIIQSTRIFRTLSCRVLYRSRAIFELQHDNTCLLDWMFRQRGHRGSTDIPHLERFDAVGSCCWIAFRTQLYIGLYYIHIYCPAHLINVALLNDSLIDFIIFPWISNNDIHLKFVWICFSFKIFRADERSLLLEIMESMFI